MPTYTFYLDLSREQMLSYYRGEMPWIKVTSQEGAQVQFPADRLRPFVSDTGVSGRFRLKVTPANKFIELKKLD